MSHTTTKNPTEERRGGKCFCHACHKEGFRRSELSPTWLCPACRARPGVRGYEDPATRGLRDPKTVEYWKRARHQLNIVTGDEEADAAAETARKKYWEDQVAPTAKTKALGACAQVREIADGMPDAEPAAVYAKCEAAGIHARTTRAEYANWSKAKFGKTPSERFAKKG